jgi:hypothetical protein
VVNRKQKLKQNWQSKQAPRPLRPYDKSNRSKESSNAALPGILVAPASHKVDPFNTLPVDGGGDTQYLMSNSKLPPGLSLRFPIDNNTNNQIVYTVFYPTDRPYSTVRPSFGEMEVTRNLLDDSATAHMMLAQVALALSSLSSIDLSYNVAYRFGQAIAIANKRVANFHREPITQRDGAIQIVHVLIQFEVRTLSVSDSFISIAN